MSQPGWQSTGDYQMIEEIDRIPDYDPRAGAHLWCITSMYRWGGPTIETPILDLENLLCVAGPGCYYCQQIYSPQIATRRCKGRP